MQSGLKTYNTSAAWTQDREEILNFLHNVGAGVLATANVDGSPHASVIYFMVDDRGGLCFVTKRLTRKSENLARDNRASLVAYDLSTQTTAQVIGKVREITDVFESQTALAAILQVAFETGVSEKLPLNKLQAGDYITYRLTPSQLYMVDFGD